MIGPCMYLYILYLVSLYFSLFISLTPSHASYAITTPTSLLITCVILITFYYTKNYITSLTIISLCCYMLLNSEFITSHNYKSVTACMIEFFMRASLLLYWAYFVPLLSMTCLLHFFALSRQ